MIVYVLRSVFQGTKQRKIEDLAKNLTAVCSALDERNRMMAELMRKQEERRAAKDAARAGKMKKQQ